MRHTLTTIRTSTMDEQGKRLTLLLKRITRRMDAMDETRDNDGFLPTPEMDEAYDILMCRYSDLNHRRNDILCQILRDACA